MYKTMTTGKGRAITRLCDLTQCCICLKTFTDPRMLPCVHTFCFQCLQDLAEKSNKKPGDEIKCPVCRKEFAIPSDGIQGLQKNFFMASFAEVRHAFNQTQVALPCEICKANNDSTVVRIPEATMRCLNCQENLCEGCCKMHKSFKTSRNHDFRKIGSEARETASKILQMNCNIHLGKPLDYYCADCKKVVCVSCFVESHKAHDCKDVNTVEEEFRQSIKSNADIISTLAEELLTKKEKMESKEEFLRKIAEREKEILQRSKELKDMIDEHTKSLLSSLAEMKNRHLKEIQVEEEELDRRLTILESFSRYCDELRTKGSASEVCRNKDELLRRADELEEGHETYIMRPRVSFDVIFQATNIYNNWRAKKNGNFVGYVTVTENVEQLEEICAVNAESNDIYKISLCSRNETVDYILRDKAFEVNWWAVAAVYDNTMFISGCQSIGDNILKYNFTSGWKNCGTMVVRRGRHCAEFIGETMYICGGYGKIDSIEAYNALTEESAMVGQLKFGSEFSTCIAYNGSIYVFGGIGRCDTSLDCVQVYNPVDKTCTLLPKPIPSPWLYFRSVLWENYALLLCYDTCLIFDLNKMVWQERQQFKTDEMFFGMVVENGRIFTIGGDDARYVRVSSILNNEAAKWKTHIRLPKTTSVRARAKLTFIKTINDD